MCYFVNKPVILHRALSEITLKSFYYYILKSGRTVLVVYSQKCNHYFENSTLYSSSSFLESKIENRMPSVVFKIILIIFFNIITRRGGAASSIEALEYVKNIPPIIFVIIFLKGLLRVLA